MEGGGKDGVEGASQSAPQQLGAPCEEHSTLSGDPDLWMGPGPSKINTEGQKEKEKAKCKCRKETKVNDEKKCKKKCKRSALKTG